MADKKDTKKPPRPRTSPEDMDKTVVDMDIRDLDFGMDETVMVRAPKDEDSDLHDLEPMEEKEPAEKPKKETTKPPPSKATPTPKELTPPKPPKPAKPAPAPKPSLPLRAATALESSYQIIRHERSWLFTLLGLAVLLLLAEALLEVLRQGSALRLPMAVATGMAGLVFAGLLLRRVESKKGFLWLMNIFFGVTAYAGYLYFTSDPESLHFFKISLDAAMGPIFCLVALTIAAVLFFEKKLSWFVKILGAVVCLAVWIAYGFCLARGLSLEGDFWGPEFVRRAPLLLRPVVLVLAFAFPSFVFVLFAGVLSSKSFRRRFLGGLGLPLLTLSLIGAGLGARLLMRQGVEAPFLGRFVRESFFGTTPIDPANSALQLTIQESASVSSRRLNLQVFASNPSEKNNARQSFFLVRNGEGRTFATDLNPYLSLSRGDRKITGVKSVLELARLGAPREIALLVNFSAVLDPNSQILVASGILRLAELLQTQDKMFLISASGIQVLTSRSRDSWKAAVMKVFAGPPAQWQDLQTSAQKSFTKDAGLRQIVLLSDAAALAPSELRQSLTADSLKAQRSVAFVVLGKPADIESNVYVAGTPSAIGFELLSAAAESFGDFSLKLPNFAQLPKIALARDAAGQVVMQQGRLNFRLLVQDPAMIQTLQLKVDGDKPLDLDPRLLEQQVDLAKYKVKPGLHRFSLILTTQTGDVVSESFETKYFTRQPLQFVKPLDRDTIAGSFNILFSPGRVPGSEISSIDFLVDGNKMGSATTEPYLVPFDANTLSEGDHVLQAVQTYSDGTSESAQITVIANPKVPQVKIVRPTLGEYLPNLAELEAEVGGGLFQQVQKVEFLVDGEWVGESLQAPFRFLWSNTSYPTGKYFIQARAHLSSQATVTDAVQVQLGEGELVIQADPNLSASGMMFPENVEILLDQSVAMNQAVGSAIKSDLAKFALASLATGIPDSVSLNARIYGGGSEAQQGNCRDSALLKNPAQQAGTLAARGMSPLAYALEQMSKDLKKSSGSRVGLLIASGWDKCGEDPIAVAERLVKQGDRLRLHIIYFDDVDPGTESLLKRLAEVLGGRVYAVRDQEGIEKALQDAMQVSFSIFDYRNTPVVEQPLSQKPFSLRAGEYRLEVDTAPPLKKDNLSVSTGAKKIFTVFHHDGKYEIQGE